MKVRVHGFSWQLTSGTNLIDFLKFLHETSGEQIKDQIMAVSPIQGRKGIWGGVLLTIKDQKSFTQFTRRAKSFRVTPTEMALDTNPVDVNYFILNEENGRGLYQYYHHSAALSAFAGFAAQRFTTYKSIQGIGQGRLKQRVIFRETAFKEHVQQLERIKRIEFEAETYVPNESTFRSLSEQADRVRHRLVFFVRGQSDQESIKNKFFQLLQEQAFSFARVEGEDSSGLEAVYKLLNDPDYFAEIDYDEFVKTVTIDADDFDKTINNAANIGELLRLYTDEKLINRLMTVEEV